jgi:hypothetical protein
VTQVLVFLAAVLALLLLTDGGRELIGRLVHVEALPVTVPTPAPDAP